MFASVTFLIPHNMEASRPVVDGFEQWSLALNLELLLCVCLQVERLRRQVMDKSLFVEQFQSDMNNAIGFAPLQNKQRLVSIRERAASALEQWVEPEVSQNGAYKTSRSLSHAASMAFPQHLAARFNGVL
jgi:hypothetical protein